MIASTKSKVWTWLFEHGSIVATPAAVEALGQNGVGWSDYMNRHLLGDWGLVDAADRRLNDAAIKDGSRIMSAYMLPDETRLWIITDAANDDGHREVTTLLLPEDY